MVRHCEEASAHEGKAMNAPAVVRCPRCGTSNVCRLADPWGHYTGPCECLYQCLDGCEATGYDDGRPFTFDPRDSSHCACCGEGDASRFDSCGLCWYCASGSCEDCAVTVDGVTSGPIAWTAEDTCSMCHGEGILEWGSVRVSCNGCAGRGTVTSHPLDGYAETPLDVLYMLTAPTYSTFIQEN